MSKKTYRKWKSLDPDPDPEAENKEPVPVLNKTCDIALNLKAFESFFCQMFSSQKKYFEDVIIELETF